METYLNITQINDFTFCPVIEDDLIFFLVFINHSFRLIYIKIICKRIIIYFL